MFNKYKQASLVIILSALLSCGGGEQSVGNQNDAAPIAVAEVHGSSKTTSGIVKVRSGKDVLLSGLNSDGVDDPLLTFSWQQVDTTQYQVDLYERTSNAVVFTAPNIPLNQEHGVELEFELTVVDGDGQSVADRVKVLVEPAYDTNRFLLNPRVDEQFILIVAADENTTIANDIPFMVNMSVVANWQDRQLRGHQLEVLSSQFTGIVDAGIAPTLTDRANTFFRIPIPLLVADQINKHFQGDLREGRLEFEKVPSASLTITLSLTQQATGSIDLYLAKQGETQIELLDSNGATRTDTTLSFNDEWLRQTLEVESRRSATNYYDCIDPTGQAQTLSQWIDYAGFNDYPESVVHTSYVNNYDLNFGRDMYVREDENGNVYTYVTNYPSLENIFSGRNEFAVVVMEYSAAPTGNCGDGTFTDNVRGKKIVKFYSYVPDETTGEYVRMPSMNFDGRGERSLPGVCVACHYGDTNADQFNNFDLSSIDAEAADLDSSFIPYDLDAFLYTESSDDNNIDPVYQKAEFSSDVTLNFSREAQEEAFRQQNQIILNTFTHDINNLKRFEIPIKMVQAWYGNRDIVEPLNFGSEQTPLSQEELETLQETVSTLPVSTFNGGYVQSGWEGQETLYHEVFARNCRLCHAQVANPQLNFDTYEEFITNEKLVSYIFEQGTMPLSRLTMDRFWVDFYDSESPAEILRQHLNSDDLAENDVGANVKPGFPAAVVSPARNPSLAADVIIDFDQEVLFDGSKSLFADSYEWLLDGRFSSDKEKFNLTIGNPGDTATVQFLATNSEASLVSRTVTRTVSVNNNTPSASGVPAVSVIEGGSVTINLFESLCPGFTPDSQNCRSVFGDIRTGEVPILTLGDTIVNGNVSVLSESEGSVTFTSTESLVLGDGQFNFALTDSFGEQSEFGNVIIKINSISGPEVVGPDTCEVSAYNFETESSYPLSFDAAPCVDPSSNDIPPEGLSLQVAEVGVADRSGSLVQVSTSGIIEYTPERFFVGQDSFTYTVQDSSLSQRSSTGTVLVTINPTLTYTSLSTGNGVFARNNENDGCAECHTGNQAGAPNWLEASNVRLAATNTNAAPFGDPEITLASPTTREDLITSILFQNACNAFGSHTGENRLCITAGSPSSVEDLNADGRAILRWLEEGAQDN